MIKQFKTTPFLLIFLIMVLAGCKKEMDKYYERPSTLAPPIYQQLQATGRFTNYLKLVDKSGYKNVLSRTGFITAFVPSDSAFEAYFAAKGISGASIDSAEARKIITYMLLYNGYRVSDFDRYQGGADAVDSMAFKRKTYYYKGFFETDIVENGAKQHVAVFDFGSDFNNKFVPIFTNAFFQFNRLEATDYTSFFPNTPFSGMNVADARIITADMLAENGYWHEVNKVIEPLPNVEEIIATDPKYSKFKQLLDTFVTHLYDANLTATYQKYVSGLKAYLKAYTNISFSPNNEFDTQAAVGTMFVPTNEAFDKIMNERIALYAAGKDYRNLPLQVLANFIKVHMFPGSVWPSQFGTLTNFNEESPRFDFATNIVDKKFGSNCIFYGTNIAQASDIFMSVYGDVYLNPDVSMFLYGLANKNMTKAIASPSNRYSLFMLTNSSYQAAGFEYDPNRGTTALYYNGAAASNTVLSAFNDAVGLLTTDEVVNISGKGLVESYFGDVIGYDNGKIFTAWNQDNNRMVNCTPVPNSMPSNGTVYYCDTALRMTSQKILYHVNKHFSATRYWNYLKYNKICDTIGGGITGIKDNVLYTMLIPNDDAIQEAIDNGDLPADPKTDLDKTKRFILLHLIKEKSIIANGKRNANGGFLTLLSLGTGSAPVTVTNTIGSLSFTDIKGKTVSWDPNNSNVLSNKAVIHTIKGYLQY